MYDNTVNDQCHLRFCTSLKCRCSQYFYSTFHIKNTPHTGN